MAANQLGQLCQLAAGDLHAGLLGARLEALGDLPQHVGVGLLDRDVVEHRDRLRADADHVVHVHRDAIDADRVEAAELLGDDDLRTDAVGGQRDAEPLVDAQDVGVVARAEYGAGLAARVDRAQHGHERGHRLVGARGVDAGAGVGAVGHGGH